MTDIESWLRLIEIQGPFLSEPATEASDLPVLESVSPVIRRRIRDAHSEWLEVVSVGSQELHEIHQAWIDEVFNELLGFTENEFKPLSAEKLKACIDPEICKDCYIPSNGIFIDNEATNPVMLVDRIDPSQEFDQKIASDVGVTTPLDNMIALLKASKIETGVITNGEKWTLVHAVDGEPVSHGTWHARLWFQEPKTFQTFVGLLRVARIYGPENVRLPFLFRESRNHQSDVTDTLGDQVARAIEVLIRSLDRADDDRNRELLHGIKPAALYEAGLTVMMRMVFLLAAEERGLMLLGEPKYDANYALSSLRAQLKKKTDAQLDNDIDAWSRLLALFRLVYGGSRHPTMSLPAMGGSLFDPDRFPFLEGRKTGSTWESSQSHPLPINDRTVLFLLDAIQLFKGRSLSYAGLDVEQIGHVYEGLLEKTVHRVADTTIQLKSTSAAKNPFITLHEIEKLAAEHNQQLIDLIAERAGKQARTILDQIQTSPEEILTVKLLTVCKGDKDLSDQLLPYLNCIELDGWGYPLVHPKGAFVVGLGQDRRASGSHYTPKALTEKVVEETLIPIVYEGPSLGVERANWKLKPPHKILDLKVCDPAMGSAAFLVQTCRWLADRLVEAWSEAEQDGAFFNADGTAIIKEAEGEVGLLPKSTSDRVVVARRLIAERCLYGVDMNPLAVELAKLSLWLTTISKGYPFGFLDHNLKCGNSLIGLTNAGQLINLSMNGQAGAQGLLFGREIEGALEEATGIRETLRSVPIRDIGDVHRVAHLDLKANDRLKTAILLSDALVGIELAEINAPSKRARLSELAALSDNAINGDIHSLEKLSQLSAADLETDEPEGKKRTPFHWVIEFPEVFGKENPGFDAFVGNPPFLGGQRITGAAGTAARNYFVNVIANGQRGSADLVAYFFLQTYSLLRDGGALGLIAVNTIAEGDTREVGLEKLINSGASIFAAYPDEPWPGDAAVVTSRLHINKGDWHGVKILDGRPVNEISAYLSDENQFAPSKLLSNKGVAFQGCITRGLGFVIDQETAKRIIEENETNRDVIFPYINGKDLNSNPDQSASRQIINFWDWDETKSSKYESPFTILKERVRPERLRTKSNGGFVLNTVLREKWWLYESSRKNLFWKIGRGKYFDVAPANSTSSELNLTKVIVAARVGKYLSISMVPNDAIFSDQTVVFASADFGLFANLVSVFHGLWVERYASRLKQDLRYTPTDCFETFALVSTFDDLKSIGKKYSDLRSEMMLSSNLGLTKFYNEVHDANSKIPNIPEFREIKSKLDQSVADAYGWSDLKLDHDFFEVPELPDNDNVRFTLSGEIRREILNRLGDLNIQRFEAEQT